MSIKFASVKKFIFPLPQNRYFKKSCAIEEVAFHEGQLFIIYLYKSQKAFRMFTLFECRYLEDNCLVQSGDFCIHEYKICFCKEVYISPYPKIVIFKNHVQ